MSYLELVLAALSVVLIYFGLVEPRYIVRLILINPV